MLHALNMYQPVFAGVKLTDDGLDIADLERVFAEKSPKALFVCPNFQNPSGITYTEANRAEIARVIKQHNAILVEDDPYSELGFDGTAGVTFRKYLGDQSVVLGSFSKIVSPGMRLGWAIAGPEVMHRLIIAKQGTDFHTSSFSQRVLHEYLVRNPLDAHVAHIQKGYGKQCAAMEASIARHFPAGTVVHMTKPRGGMFIWMTLPEEIDAVKLLDVAIDAGVTFLPGATFYTDGGGKNQIRLSYSLLDEARIDEGVKRLAGAVVRCLDAAAAA
jgi:2-aminoadipate transaminase